MKISRRNFLIFSGAMLGSSGYLSSNPFRSKSSRPGIAITVDDFRITDDVIMDFASRDQFIREGLADHHIQAGAFPIGNLMANPLVHTAVVNWSSEGHIIANHTHTHPYYGGNKPKAMMANVMKAEAVLQNIPNYRKWLRFPYLGEGKTAKGRDDMRTLLRRKGYRNAHVTIDTSDWYINNRLINCLSDNPKTDLKPYRNYYVNHLWKRAVFYQQLTIDVTGRTDLPHVILLHHNLTSALFLRDALSMFKQRGWALIDIEAAYQDSFYDQIPNSLPAGQSLIWALANQSGRFSDQLRYPGESGKYEAPLMDAAFL